MPSVFFPLQEQALSSQNRMKFLTGKTRRLLGKFSLEFENADGCQADYWE